MKLYFKIKSESGVTLNKTEFIFTDFTVDNNIIYKISLLNGKISYEITSNQTGELKSSEYTYVADAIKKIIINITETPTELTNGNELQISDVWDADTQEKEVGIVIIGKGYVGHPNDVLKKRLQNICNELKTKFNAQDTKINGNYIEDFIKTSPDGLQKFYEQRGNLEYFCYKVRNNSYLSLKNLIVSNGTSAQYMFHQSSIQNFDDLFDTSNLGNCAYMFSDCQSLKTVKINTLNNTSLSYIFQNCYALETAEISDWNASSSSVFNNCHRLTKAIIRRFKNYNIGNDIFTNCYRFKGTVNGSYNPNGLKDGKLFVPSKYVEELKIKNYWNAVATQITPIFGYKKLGNGSVTRTDTNTGSILKAVAENGSEFNGWYTGEIKFGFNKIPGTEQQCEITNVSGQTYGFVLNSDGWYESNNKAKQSSTAYGRFYFTITDTRKISNVEYISYGESNYDYGQYYLYKADGTLVLSNENLGSASSIVNITSKFLSIENGDYYLEVRYKKDSSQDKNNDSLKIKVEVADGTTEDYIDGEIYSEDSELNLGVIDEETMEPLGLIAYFKEVS